MDPLDDEMESLYQQIHSEANPEECLLQAVACPAFVYHKTAERFQTALNRVVGRLNAKLRDDLTVRYEGALRWSMLGTVRCEWLEFELVNTETFSVTQQLRGTAAVCSLRRQTKQMEADVRKAIKPGRIAPRRWRTTS